MMRPLKKTLLLTLLHLGIGFFPLLAQGQIITTIAGGGPTSFMGNGGPATLANIGGPDDIALDSHGNLFIADPIWLLIRKVDMTTGIITTVAGDGTYNPGYSGDGGPATLAEFNYPSGLAFDAQDNMYIADYYNNVVRKVDAVTGIITTVVGTGVSGFTGDGGPATLATLQNPLRLRFDSSGDLLIADSLNGAIRKVNRTTHIITTIAGSGTLGYSGDGGPATLAQMAEPQGMDFDSLGNIYVTDSDNHVVRKINKATGIITTIAGTGAIGYTGDNGPATLATLSEEPDGVLVGCGNNIYVTDDINNVIRMISGSTGIITTFAGAYTVTGGVTTGLAGYSGDGGPPLGAKMNHPEAIIFDAQGNMLEAEYFSGVVRKITLACVFTPTPTSTPSSTPSNSPTPTPSKTPTNSPTNSPSYTPSPSPTNSPTKTPTSSPTNSPTATLTPTDSSTPTISSTPTNTPTNTPSSTPTDTPTVTPTNTPSNTPTLTPTDTPTSTPTLTPTNSPSNTATNSPTVTPTNTPSNTPTKTYTPTNTWTPTITFTPTFTPTSTWAIQLGKQVSKITAQSGDILTYTLAVTVLGNLVSGVVITDTLPAQVTFVGLGTPSAGAATFNAGLSLLSWTLPSPHSVGTYSLTYSTQIDPLVPGNVAIVNGAQLTCLGLGLPLNASVTVTTTGNYTVRVSVYNEAGEVIRSLLVKQFSQSINSFTLSGNAINSLNGPQNRVDLFYNGASLGSWDGTGSDGNPVSNGVYHIKMDCGDPYGVVSSVTQTVTVSRNLAQIAVLVYNEAGEIVRHLMALVDDASGIQMTDMTLSQSSLRFGNAYPASSSVEITLQTSGSPVTLFWDGRTDSGSYVTNGHYQLVAGWLDGRGGASAFSQGIVVIQDNETQGGITARPNLIKVSGGQTTVLFEDHSGRNLTLKVGIYTISGELVTRVVGGVNQAAWDASHVASGIYLAAVEALDANGKTASRQVLKIMVLH